MIFDTTENIKKKTTLTQNIVKIKEINRILSELKKNFFNFPFPFGECWSCWKKNVIKDMI